MKVMKVTLRSEYSGYFQSRVRRVRRVSRVRRVRVVRVQCELLCALRLEILERSLQVLDLEMKTKNRKDIGFQT